MNITLNKVYTHAFALFDKWRDKYDIDFLAFFNKNVKTYKNAYNYSNAYHNFMHAVSTLYFTDLYYRLFYKRLKSINKDALLIAAFLHDVGYDKNKDEFYNIRKAIDIIYNLKYYNHENRVCFDIKMHKMTKLIAKYIEFTEYPYPKYNYVKNRQDKLIMDILRAADMSQILISDIDGCEMLINLYCKEKNNNDTDAFRNAIKGFMFYENITKRNKIFKRMWFKYKRRYL